MLSLLAMVSGCASLQTPARPEGITVVYSSRGEGEIEPCG